MTEETNFFIHHTEWFNDIEWYLQFEQDPCHAFFRDYEYGAIQAKQRCLDILRRSNNHPLEHLVCVKLWSKFNNHGMNICDVAATTQRLHGLIDAWMDIEPENAQRCLSILVKECITSDVVRRRITIINHALVMDREGNIATRPQWLLRTCIMHGMTMKMVSEFIDHKIVGPEDGSQAYHPDHIRAILRQCAPKIRAHRYAVARRWWMR